VSINLGVVMDPIGAIKVAKDSTFAMLLEAQSRGWRIWYLEQSDLWLDADRAMGRMRELLVQDHPEAWHRFVRERTTALAELDAILMRKDPPFDMEYIYTTYILERAEAQGTLVANRPQSLRDANEKVFTAWFPQCCAPTLVTRSRDLILGFLAEHGEIILKPLAGMGGASVFRVGNADPNINVIIETLTDHGARYAMAQRFIPQIAEGDKRILMIDGAPIDYALARVPRPGETRGNLAAGGTGHGVPLSDRDRWIAAQVGPSLRERGILFAGLDVIGDYLTEINVTSPTCIRELDRQFDLNISAALMDRIEEKLAR
jgi:glutathione synthase